MDKHTGKLAVSLGFVALYALAPVYAGTEESEMDAIESIRFDPVEMHFGDVGATQAVAREKLGEMPLPILDDSGNGFVKILMPDGSEGWINRSDVQVGGVEIKAVCAKMRSYTKARDSGSAHLRGVSRTCD